MAFKAKAKERLVKILILNDTWIEGTPVFAGETHEIEESIWERMHFARHLREQRLGEFTIGTALHRSDSLAVVQLLILYHLVCARAAVAGGHGSTRDMDLSTLDKLVSSTQTVSL